MRTVPEQAVRLVELLDEAKDKCAENIRARREEDIASGALSPEEVDASASVMGYGAVKYSDLKNNRMTNYKCAWRPLVASVRRVRCFAFSSVRSMWVPSLCQGPAWLC